MEGSDLADTTGLEKRRGTQPSIAIVFEPAVSLMDGVEDLVAQARRENIEFVGIVSMGEDRLSPFLCTALLEIGAPLHVFPFKLYADLRAALHDRNRSNIIVLGHGAHPWLDLAIYLDHALTIRPH
jgi:hypothetical protein